MNERKNERERMIDRKKDTEKEGKRERMIERKN